MPGNETIDMYQSPARRGVVAGLKLQGVGPNGTASPVTAMPLRQLLKFEKVSVASKGSATVQMRVNVSSIPTVDRQPWPGILKLWVGDGGGFGGAPAPQRRLATAEESASVQLTF